MVKVSKGSNLSALVLAGAMGATAFAQTAPTPASPDASQPTASPSGQATPMSPSDASTYATGKPLENQSKEGFWGHMNPFARKKWVRREVDPIKDRANELDQLQAKNANDIRDVDKRSQAGINSAMMAANAADSHAVDAANRANAAQTTANGATSRTDALNGTVSNLDQYSEVSASAIPFASGRTALGPKGKTELDEMATKLSGEKGYIIEVQGYSKGGVQSSQAMADSVVRYLVTEHQVPVYRIYRTGLGKQTDKAVAGQAGQTAVVNGVRVTLLHNSLATMGSNAAPTTSSNNSTTAPLSGQTQQSPAGVNQ